MTVTELVWYPVCPAKYTWKINTTKFTMLKEEVKLVGLLNFKTPIKEVGSEIVHICRYVMYSENMFGEIL